MANNYKFTGVALATTSENQVIQYFKTILAQASNP